MSFVLPDPGPHNADFAQPADRDHLERTAEALRSQERCARYLRPVLFTAWTQESLLVDSEPPG